MSASPQPGRVVRMLWAGLRLAMAAFMIFTIMTQLNASLAYATEHGHHMPTALSNFFSFFTILSNIWGVVALLVAGLWLFARGAKSPYEPRAVSVLMLCASTYLITTGVVYNLLLRGIPLPQGTTVPWANEGLHVVAPAFFLVEVVLRLAWRPHLWRDLWWAVAFPIVWVIYTLVRGEFITAPATGRPWWYPYPFLDPYQQPNGYLGVAMWVIVIAAIIVALAGVIVFWTRVGRHRDEDVPVSV